MFDTDGAFIEEFYQYSRPSGLHIAADDTVYVADSASSRNGQHPGWEYGIRIGNLRTGSLDWFIDGSNPEGVTVAGDGTVVRRRRGVRRRSPEIRPAGRSGRGTLSAPSADRPAVDDGLPVGPRVADPAPAANP